MHILSFLSVLAVLSASLSVIGATLIGNWARIVEVLAGLPVGYVAQPERRAARGWNAGDVRVKVVPLRLAA